MSGPQQEPVKSPLASAIGNFLCVVTLAVSSLATFAYLQALQPLYGTAPATHNLNKVVWAACIFGSFAPTIRIGPAVLAGGILLAAMPVSAYWVGALTGRFGDIIWGPVATHLAVIAPVLYLSSALVKAFQEAPDQNGVAAAASMIGVPVCRMAIMSLQELWPLVPYINRIDENSLLQYLGSFAVTAWVLSPFLIPNAVQAPSAPQVDIPEPPAPPGTSKSKKKGKSAPSEKAVQTPSAPPPQARSKSSSSNNSWRIMILPSIPLLINFGLPPTLVKPLSQPWEHPTAPLRVLSSVRSPYSGIVLVGDILPPRTAAEAENTTYPHSLRYLRAGHSLLGGVWTGGRSVSRDGVTGYVSLDESGTPLGDSIYSTFVMQEAARLVVQNQNVNPPKTALTIGLGTGIAASAFIHHGMSTTVVELDPAVHEAAQKYFGLAAPEPGKLFLQDARGWVHQKRAELDDLRKTNVAVDDSEELFDVVIHDCFSGGGVPGHMFTLAFWEDLKAIMRPTGVVAVNFAGKLASESSRAIVLTLDKAFGQCRAFHDSLETLSEEQLASDFVNWVFFCTPTSDPIQFRAPEESDFLNSFLRERVLLTLPEREVDLHRIAGEVKDSDREKFILTDMHNPLVEWQQKDALHHWKVMREVLPDVFWETF